MSTYQDRPITVYTLPATEGVVILHPDQAVVKYGSLSYDLGALCFLVRSSKKREAGKGRQVDLRSYQPKRADNIQKIAERLLAASAQREIAETSALKQCEDLVRFLDWCDENNLPDVLLNVDQAREGLRSYVAELRHRFDTNKQKLPTAYHRQAGVLRLLNSHFEIANINLGINLIRWDERLAGGTEPPTDYRMQRFLSLTQAVFTGICDLVLNKKRYPHPVSMPSFVGYQNDLMWIFPLSIGAIKHPSTTGTGAGLVYDHDNGKLRSLDEISNLYSKPETAKKALWYANALLDEGNSNMRCAARMRLAAHANHLFASLFAAITGENQSSILTIEWTKELQAQITKPDTSRQGFRSLKARADNREVHYQVGIKYMPLLRQFVALRDYLLHGSNYKLMFFYYIVDGERSGPRDWDRTDGKTIGYTMQVIYPEYKSIKVNAKEIRAAKHDHAIRNYDPPTAAKILQHSLPTTLKKYSAGSSSLAQEEIGGFLQRVYNVALVGRGHDPIEEERAAGGCTARAEPHAIEPSPPVQPDCKSGEGCLFCDKYRAHSDDKDVRKILSARYVIEQISRLTANSEEQSQVFKRTIKRIDQILDQIREVDPPSAATIKRITSEVALGQMDMYWSSKLEELVEIGII